MHFSRPTTHSSVSGSQTAGQGFFSKMGRAVVSRIIGTIELDPNAPPAPCLSCASEVLPRRCGEAVDERIAARDMLTERATAVEFVEIDAEQLLGDLNGEFSRLMR